jgi:hypothetical protein
MRKTRRPAPGKSRAPAEDDADILTLKLCDLALAIVELEDRPDDPLKHRESDLRKIIRKCFYQKKDDILLEALDRTAEAGIDAYQMLKDTVEELSGVILVRNDQGMMLEVNAFAIPVFAHTTGGLDPAQGFQDEEAFDLLTKSFIDAKLESPDAQVVMVSHAYHPDEINRIGYSHLNEMVHDAHATMTRRKLTATPAIDRSIAGWPDTPFGKEDRAVELRFLLGFVLKPADDDFYRVPGNEKAADMYFARREERFRGWAEKYAPLVKRCLVTDGRDIELHFLYQDLFHGAKERGMSEYHTLQMMAELNHGLQEYGVDPAQAKAIMGPAENADGTVLRVNLYRAVDDALLASADRPMEAVRDLQLEADDVYDALTTLGVGSFALAQSLEVDGQAVGVRPYEA